MFVKMKTKEKVRHIVFCFYNFFVVAEGTLTTKGKRIFTANKMFEIKSISSIRLH